MSLWQQNITKKSYDTLEENKRVDTLIIGGGMVGVQTLYFMQDQDVCLVEANEIGCGVSANTTGKINYLQESTLGYLIKKGKLNQAKMYLASQKEGMKVLLDIIQREHISCDLEQVSSYLVTKNAKYVQDLKKIKKFLEDVSNAVTEELPGDLNQFLYGIGVDDTFVFHSLKYLYGLVSCISKPIYEHTRIINIKKKNDYYYCKTNQGNIIAAHHVIVACHYPFFLFPYFLPIKTSIEKAYMVSYKVIKNLKYTYITMESPSESCRFHETEAGVFKIVLGSSHGTSMLQNDEQNFQKIFSKVPNSSMSFWSNVDIMTMDHLPFIGEFFNHLYLANGFYGWGMIQSTLSAYMLSEQLKGKRTPYDKMFSLHRAFLKKLCFAPYYLLLNGFSFLRSKWLWKSWYPDNLTFFWKDGKYLANYRDEFGHNHTVHPVCPHMKCGLIFNHLEKTWDCPCHSSRFSLDGDIIKGPSKYSIKVLKD